MPEFESFVKACTAFFGEPKISITEFKALTTEDKVELSTELNKVGYTHPQYVPKATA